MTFYAARERNAEQLIFSMNPLLRGMLVLIFLSSLLTLLFNMTAQEFRDLSPAGKISTILCPLLLFLGSSYRYSLSFDKKTERCLLKRGLIFLYRSREFSFADLSAVNYRCYDYREGILPRGLPYARADFGFFFEGKLLQLEKAAPKKQVDGLLSQFISFFPRELRCQ